MTEILPVQKSIMWTFEIRKMSLTFGMGEMLGMGDLSVGEIP